jgi:hypothetical protein
VQGLTGGGTREYSVAARLLASAVHVSLIQRWLPPLCRCHQLSAKAFLPSAC